MDNRNSTPPPEACDADDVRSTVREFVDAKNGDANWRYRSVGLELGELAGG